MMVSQVPTCKVGTLFYKPFWRYDALKNPAAYGFDCFLSRLGTENPGHLKRLWSKDLEIEVLYQQPEFLLRLQADLPESESEQLLHLWRRQFHRHHTTKCLVHPPESAFPIWNAKKLDQLNDPWLKKLVKHVFNLEHNAAIANALELYNYEDTQEIKKYIGLSIYAGFTDVEITKQWSLSSPKIVESLRNLFFDFTMLPKQPVAHVTVLKQWHRNRLINEEEFKLYRRIHDLGQLGLKSQVAYMHLSPSERQIIDQYMMRSAMMHVYNMDFAARNVRDVVRYNQALTNLARIAVEQKNAEYKAVEVEFMRANIRKLERELAEGPSNKPIDLELFDKVIEDHMRKNNEPKHPSYPTLVQANK